MNKSKLIKTIEAIFSEDKELKFYYKGKELRIEEFCVTVDGEYKINLKKKRKLFWKGNKK